MWRIYSATGRIKAGIEAAAMGMIGTTVAGDRRAASTPPRLRHAPGGTRLAAAWGPRSTTLPSQIACDSNPL